ncbi:hypothetical protein [Acinetobacter calcoaceticus]|nr:hypothetical protein [Acinetobacter calcoaceticus]
MNKITLILLAALLFCILANYESFNLLKFYETAGGEINKTLPKD